MRDDDLPVENSSNSLNPFEWKRFKHIKRDYNLYREYLGSKIVILNHTSTAFKKNIDGTIDYRTQINFDDLKLDLKDAGFKITDRDYGSLLNSDKIQRIDSLKIFFNQLDNNKWDGKDRIKDLVSAAKLEGDFNQNHMLIKKWLCTTYAFALRGIDPRTPKKVYSRVVFILYSQQRGFGKTEFFRKIGLIGAIEKATGISGTEIYAETAGELPKDDRNFDIDKNTKMIYLLDDINQLLIKGEGKLRSIISQEDFSKRALYKDTNQNLKRRATFAGTTNYKELLRNENENRYMLFTIAERMDFDLLNSLDIMQVWSQIRDEVIRFKDKSMIRVDDLETIMNLSEEYIYHSPLETTLNNMLLFDSEGRIAFSDIMKSLKEHGIYESNNKVGSILQSMSPNGIDIITKPNKGSRLYKLKWRYN
ncbi:virulence-associated E family protein [Flavobacteriaceae bacterium]|nr:virulence-associated E family protein [Flavobacteriaceae bacterium]